MHVVRGVIIMAWYIIELRHDQNDSATIANKRIY